MATVNTMLLTSSAIYSEYQKMYFMVLAVVRSKALVLLLLSHCLLLLPSSLGLCLGPVL